MLYAFVAGCCVSVVIVYPLSVVQDRKNHGQLQRDDEVKQINFKKINTFKPRYFNSSFLHGSNSNVSSFPMPNSQINYSLPDLSDLPQEEDTVFEAEKGEASTYSPTGSKLHSTTIVNQETRRPNGTTKLSVSVEDYLHDVGHNSLQLVSNPLHSSTESDLRMGAYTNKAIADDSYDSREQLPSNGFVTTGTDSSKNNTGKDNV